jgi:hypothetical protein
MEQPQLSQAIAEPAIAHKKTIAVIFFILFSVWLKKEDQTENSGG